MISHEIPIWLFAVHDQDTPVAVLALAHGAEISEISRLLGHASTGVTERVYAEKKVVSR